MRRIGPATRRLSPWARLVTVSAVVVLGAAVVLVGWWAATSETRVATSTVRGSLAGITLDLGAGSVDVVGGGERPTAVVERREELAFGRRATVTRSSDAGRLRITARCPDAVPRSCSTAFRVVVPDNVPITIRTGGGDVRFRGFQGSADITTDSGNVTLRAVCSFMVTVRSETGDVRSDHSCPPERLDLRSRDGDVRATVPEGRYDVDVESDSGAADVRGLTPVGDAPFRLLARSGAGDVLVEATSE